MGTDFSLLILIDPSEVDFVIKLLIGFLEISMQVFQRKISQSDYLGVIKFDHTYSVILAYKLHGRQLSLLTLGM